MPVIVDVAKPQSQNDNGNGKKRRKRHRKPANQEQQQPAKLPKLDTLGLVRDYDTKADVQTRTIHLYLNIYMCVCVY